MVKDSRLIFYTDQETFDRFEESLSPVQRWVSKGHPIPNIGVPIYGWGIQEYPVLLVEETHGEG